MMAAQKVSLEKVTASITLPLPSGVKLIVKKEDKVKEGQVIARRKTSSQFKSYHLSKLIDASPEKTINYLVKKMGDRVKEGDLIAEKKGLLGKRERFVAPIDGVLDSLSEEGILKIKKEIKEKEVKAPFSGRVTTVSSTSVSLSFASIEIKGSWGSGGKATGYLTVIEGEEGDLFSLDGTCQEQIIALQGELTKGLWYKAISLKAEGFVAGGLKGEFFVKEIEEDEEAVPIVILGIDGKINQEIWGELKKTKGKTVLIDGHQQQLLIPH